MKENACGNRRGCVLRRWIGLYYKNEGSVAAGQICTFKKSLVLICSIPKQIATAVDSYIRCPLLLAESLVTQSEQKQHKGGSTVDSAYITKT